MSLREYQRKRDFRRTPEPKGGVAPGAARHEHRFVIQKHDASRLHYDLRLEMKGTLVSWAVPKGLPLLKGEKHLAVKVEDHPLSYIDFEGTIPKGEYGGGTVQVWDCGTYEVDSKAPTHDLKRGKLHFTLHGTKLNGAWHLVRLREGDEWLVIKSDHNHKPIGKVREARSAASGRTLAQIAGHAALRRPVSASRKARVKPKSVTRKAFGSIRSGGPVGRSKFIVPMMAKLVQEAPAGDWRYEIKFDGFRALAYKARRRVHLVSRTNHDLAAKFPDVADGVAALPVDEVILDGEIVALDRKGRSSFQLLQAYELGDTRPPLYYYVFDILSLGGGSVRGEPLERRRVLLERLMSKTRSQILRLSTPLGNDSSKLLPKLRTLGLEGLVGKRAGSVYEPGRRSGSWIKLKLVAEQEFVIGGYTDPAGARQKFGALLVGVYEANRLIYAGKVGTGFTGTVLRELHDQLSRLGTSQCPFADLPERRRGRYGQGITLTVMKRCHWVKPKLVCQVRFAEWTADGRLRQPSYQGLRQDKEARKVIRESPAHS